MFNRKTVFVLGSGASWHYGYPTGEELVNKVIEAADHLGSAFNDFAKEKVTAFPELFNVQAKRSHSDDEVTQIWSSFTDRCDDLANRLRSFRPLVIDNFLAHQHDELQKLGKLLVCWMIMDAERGYQSEFRNVNRQDVVQAAVPATGLSKPTSDLMLLKDNWVRFVLHKLVSGCSTASDLLKNNVDFITFNYDVSLEGALQSGLTSIETFTKQDGLVEQFITDRIVHCYGQIRLLYKHNPQAETFESYFREATDTEKFALLQGNNTFYENKKRIIDAVFEASQTIYTIQDCDKHSELLELQIAQQKLSEADVIYILGYGFDETNSERLGLAATLAERRSKVILFTNYKDSNRINKKAARIMAEGNTRAFMPPNLLIDRRFGGYLEKSVGDVYHALENDFDELEDI